jgi:hypothetical protein
VHKKQKLRPQQTGKLRARPVSHRRRARSGTPGEREAQLERVVRGTEVLAGQRVPVISPPVDGSGSLRIPEALRLLMAVASGLSLLLLVLAVVPARVLPGSAPDFVQSRRELVAFSALCVLSAGFFVSLVAILVAS